MPTATKFEAEGVGNGFPSCRLEIEVSSYDRWTTFSGVNKDNVGSFDAEQLAEKIHLSHKLAANMYWNAYSMQATASVLSTGGSSSISDVDTSGVGSRDEPRSRICGPGAGLKQATGVKIEWNPYYIAKLFNGGVFVGYGGRSIATNVEALLPSARAWVRLFGYTNESSGDFRNLIDYEYVEVGGVHYVCRANSFGNTGQTLSADASNMSASSLSEIGQPTNNAEASISDITFYTYPT